MGFPDGKSMSEWMRRADEIEKIREELERKGVDKTNAQAQAGYRFGIMKKNKTQD